MNPFDRTPEALLALMQRRFATGFPNPQREGCPAPGVLEQFVNAGQFPDDELHAHVFSCSECFNEYRIAILTQRATKAVPLRWWDAAWGWRRPVLLSACALLLFVVAFIAWRTRQAAQELGQVRPQTSPSTERKPEAPAVPDVRPSVPPAPPDKPTVAGVPREEIVSINLDLSDYASVSGMNRHADSYQTEKTLKLPRARTRLTLTLTHHDVTNRYQVKLVNDYLKSVASGQAVRIEGNRLTVSLDLRRLSVRSYYLSLAQGESAPDFYRVEIQP